VTTVNSSAPRVHSTVLSPSYKIPLVLVLAAVPVTLVQLWIGLIIALFGFFLLFQAVTIRLQFTETALDIHRSGQLIRRFPYADWQNWRIFWLPVPLLFYFKEVRSIHFLPVLFDAKTLKTCLENNCPLSK
jgi:hypothetical protein